VPVETMPTWLQTFAEHQPVSVTAAAVRDLTLGTLDGTSANGEVLASIAWSVGIIAVFGAIAVRLYRRAV
jgi:ABC-2 type transport system permease protein/oleandomycin transport system permease protein